jgi:FtsP/CotA-like multicopper oxidase with cupredoxin domain
MDINRRGFIGSLAGLLAGGLGLIRVQHAESSSDAGVVNRGTGSKQPMEGKSESFLPIETPDLPKLSCELENGVKVFHLIAEVVKREFLPGYTFDVWGYNGMMPGPSIEVQEGDTVRIVFENRLPELTSIHWHGLEVPIRMDGVPGVTQPPVPPGGKFVYEFTLHQNGTYFYHSHMAMQEMMGMIGFFVIHPKRPYQPKVDRDFGIILQEWAILPNNTIPNSMSMEFNWLTMNGKAGPATTPLIVRLGERVRIRLVNLGMDHHPIHLHGHQWVITGTEGGRIPETAWYPNNTVLVGVAQARDVEFVANNPGDWMLHCHLPHHMMNHMASMVGPPGEMGHGMRTGMEMSAGMGMAEKGNALSEDRGPGFGRGMGFGATRETNVSNMVGGRMVEQHGHAAASMQQKERVPGYPQDMWMPMDEAVSSPETYGLHKGWTGAVLGMMTLVRILPPQEYERLTGRIAESRKKKGSS